MEIKEVTFDGVRPFDGYGPGFFRIAGEVHEGPVLARAGMIRGWGGMSDIAALTDLAGEVDFILLGTGAEIAHAPADLRAAVEEAGLGLETMASPAACRTYNVLIGEDRRVAAAVLPVGQTAGA
ncbi:Mth938-like domain-containing protein [Jannaschia aquimarina]|uniref:Mth938-like domain-containing protein n=1 Tax=Jannaschia aquimarina TaxID=935700 RepID=A0A0D1EP13_9RHOB|nr:Mth938-like domain-containing protein [Jannaschia aquimarina]KIT17380.1 hypothetical protein jaqu_08690 [Jannaschia aquimarina]SNS45781.1 Uncharacterized conserved protein, contains Mth938-like domain [Jannaschia aquimarina]